MESILDPSPFIPWFLHFLVLYCTVGVDWIFVSSTLFFAKGTHECYCPGRNSTYVVVWDCDHFFVSLKMEVSPLSLILFTILWRILLKEVERECY